MKMKCESEIYFTPKQAAGCFNLSLSTVKNYIYANKLRTLKTPGGHHRIKKSELLSILGDPMDNTAGNDSFSLRLKLCRAMLQFFRILGPEGSLFIEHAQRVSRLSRDNAQAMGLIMAEKELSELGGFLHDIGNITLGKEILLKSGRLSESEYMRVKDHPLKGVDILLNVEELRDVADIVLQHHERIDRTGYPKGLKGDNIHRASRIISVAEAYDSMTSPHFYRKAVSKQEAINELMRHRGTQFDADTVEAFVKII